MYRGMNFPHANDYTSQNFPIFSANKHQNFRNILIQDGGGKMPSQPLSVCVPYFDFYYVHKLSGVVKSGEEEDEVEN